MEERGVWSSGGTEPENCIACSVISLPPGCLPPLTPRTHPSVLRFLPTSTRFSLCLCLATFGVSHRLPNLSLLPSALLHLLASYRHSPTPPFLKHTLGGSILDLSLRLEKILLPPNLKVTQLGPFLGGGGAETQICVHLFFHSKNTQGDEHRSVNQMRARPRGSPAN